MKTMKAVRIHSFGGPEVLMLEQAPIPEIADDELLIRVKASGVNPLDWKVRAGYLEGLLSYNFPLVPGWDVSGVVERTGTGVSRFKEGDEVYALPDISRDGSYAQYVAVKADVVALKPHSIDHIQAASAPLAALTAWQSLFDLGDLSAGQAVLIHGAAGGVGSFAVQFARWKGARVIGTASPRNEEFLLEMGVDRVIDYSKIPFQEVVTDLDMVLDTVGGETRDRSWEVLRKGGILVSTMGPPDGEEASSHGVRCAGVFVQPNSAQLSTIAGLIDGGKIKTNVSRVLPLAEAAEAHVLSEAGHVRGKIVLRID